MLSRTRRQLGCASYKREDARRRMNFTDERVLDSESQTDAVNIAGSLGPLRMESGIVADGCMAESAVTSSDGVADRAEIVSAAFKTKWALFPGFLDHNRMQSRDGDFRECIGVHSCRSLSK